MARIADALSLFGALGYQKVHTWRNPLAGVAVDLIQRDRGQHARVFELHYDRSGELADIFPGTPRRDYLTAGDVLAGGVWEPAGPSESLRDAIRQPYVSTYGERVVLYQDPNRGNYVQWVAQKKCAEISSANT